MWKCIVKHEKIILFISFVIQETITKNKKIIIKLLKTNFLKLHNYNQNNYNNKKKYLNLYI